MIRAMTQFDLVFVIATKLSKQFEWIEDILLWLVTNQSVLIEKCHSLELFWMTQKNLSFCYEIL